MVHMMQMLLKSIATRAQFTKDSQSFWHIVELEWDGGGIQRCVTDIEKGAGAVEVAEKLEHLARQIREA